MSNPLVIVPDNGMDAVYFDLTENERHTSTTIATSFPVEDDFDISDHIQPQAAEFGCTVFVTETPIKPDYTKGRGFTGVAYVDFPEYEPPLNFASPGGLINAGITALADVLGFTTGLKSPALLSGVLRFAAPFRAVQSIQADLDAIHKARTTCTLLTSTKYYRSMVMTSSITPIEIIGGASFQLEFKEIRKVTSANVAAPQPAEPRGAPAAKAGAKAPETATPDPTKDAQIRKTMSYKAAEVLFPGLFGG